MKILPSLVKPFVFCRVIFEWVGVSEAGRGLCKLAFGLNRSGSKSSASCHQDILHGLCAQKILKPLLTPILRKYFICVKMLILYLRTKYPDPAHSHPNNSI